MAKSADVALDRTGRVKVAPDLTIPGHPDIFVIGDLAHVTQQDGTPLPGLASVAIQEGRYVGKAIRNGSRGKPRWRSTIAIRATWPSSGAMRGWRHLGRWHLHGFVAWLAWLFVHIYSFDRLR